MGDISVILAFAHPLATVFLATLWTLHILRKDYSQAIEKVDRSRESVQEEAASLRGE